MPFQCPNWPPQWPSIKAAAVAAIESGEWGQYHSDLTKTLEKRLSSYLNSGPVRLCCSGTAALELALRCCKITEGDEVIVAAYDFPGNFRTVELLGAKPALTDVCATNPANPSQISPTICPAQLEAAASPSVRAVIASHLHGSHAEMNLLRQACDQNGWILIEDACQSIGAKIGEQATGSFGHFATLSFGGSKLISAGSGGAIIANDQRLAARLSGLLDRPGDTFPLGPLQAAVIDPQLDRLDELTQTRTLTARFLRKQVFPEMPHWELLHSPETNHPIAAAEKHNAKPHLPHASQPPSSPSTSNIPAFYKFCWLVPSREAREQVIEHGSRLGLPLGEGFRSMSRSSSKRCRKPVPTPHSEALAERLVVMDQRALLIPPKRHPELADALHALHRAVNPTQ
jgi:dTDP-4-amino-4,6-dideoxygalactose transaminase